MRAAGTATASARRSRGNAVSPGSVRSVLRRRRVFGQVDWDRRRRRRTIAPTAASRKRFARGKAAPLGRRARRGRGRRWREPERVCVAIKRRSKPQPAKNLDKLAEVTPSLVPFVHAFYARQSVYLWWDGAGACRRILQGDGCEQGDALAPALFALAQHAALVAASQQLRPGEFLAAFLDDLYIVTVPNRARAALEAVSSAVEELAGVAANLGKTRVYNRAWGAALPGIASAPRRARRRLAGGPPPCFSSSARGRSWSFVCHTRLLGGLGRFLAGHAPASP